MGFWISPEWTAFSASLPQQLREVTHDGNSTNNLSLKTNTLKANTVILILQHSQVLAHLTRPSAGHQYCWRILQLVASTACFLPTTEVLVRDVQICQDWEKIIHLCDMHDLCGHPQADCFQKNGLLRPCPFVALR